MCTPRLSLALAALAALARAAPRTLRAPELQMQICILRENVEVSGVWKGEMKEGMATGVEHEKGEKEEKNSDR